MEGSWPLDLGQVNKRAHHRSMELPDRLDLPDGWQPEGIAAGRGTDLYVGSIPTGAVLRLDARTGEARRSSPPRADGRPEPAPSTLAER